MTCPVTRSRTNALRSGRLFAAAVSFATAAYGCSGSTTLESSKDPSHASLDAEEQALLAAINDRRVAKGVPVVTTCASLDASASLHSDDMRDHHYLSDVAKDGSTVRLRACESGYQGGCSEAAAMAELVSEGVSEPSGVVDQWTSDAKTSAILLNPSLVVVGIGRAEGAAPPVWTLDLGSVDEPSCQ
jgi:uncharacterized protein YkwD